MSDWKERARKRDKKRAKRKYGMRTDGNSTKLIQVQKAKRARK